MQGGMLWDAAQAHPVVYDKVGLELLKKNLRVYSLFPRAVTARIPPRRWAAGGTRGGCRCVGRGAARGCLRCALLCLHTALCVLWLFLVLRKVRFPAVPLPVCFPAQGVTHSQPKAAPVLVTLGLYSVSR